MTSTGYPLIYTSTDLSPPASVTPCPPLPLFLSPRPKLKDTVSDQGLAEQLIESGRARRRQTAALERDKRSGCTSTRAAERASCRQAGRCATRGELCPTAARNRRARTRGCSPPRQQLAYCWSPARVLPRFDRPSDIRTGAIVRAIARLHAYKADFDGFYMEQPHLSNGAGNGRREPAFLPATTGQPGNRQRQLDAMTCLTDPSEPIHRNDAPVAQAGTCSPNMRPVARSSTRN